MVVLGGLFFLALCFVFICIMARHNVSLLRKKEEEKRMKMKERLIRDRKLMESWSFSIEKKKSQSYETRKRNRKLKNSSRFKSENRIFFRSNNRNDSTSVYENTKNHEDVSNDPIFMMMCD